MSIKRNSGGKRSVVDFTLGPAKSLRVNHMQGVGVINVLQRDVTYLNDSLEYRLAVRNLKIPLTNVNT